MELNQKVWIHAMGSYYAGTVVKVTATRLLVRYTSGAEKTREKWVTYDAEMGRYINSKYEKNFPVVDGAHRKPAGARTKGGGLFSCVPMGLAD